MAKNTTYTLFLVLFPLLGLSLYFRGELKQWYSNNRMAVNTTHIAFKPGDSAGKSPKSFSPENTPTNCRTKWLRGLVEESQGDDSERNILWEEALQCEPMVVNFLAVLLPEERALAQKAVDFYPSNPESWFWLAGTFFEGDVRSKHISARAKLIEMYRAGLEKAPLSAMRWRELGDLLVPVDSNAAIEAYLKSCLFGDPGSNGCWRAGRAAEQLGDIESAIRYYRYSRWEGARSRADELEALLNP